MAKRDDVPGLPAILKAARESAGLSQAAAAEASTVGRTNITGFETGTKTPTLATLYKLAEAYRVNVCELLPGGKYEGKSVPAMPPAVSPAKKGKAKKGKK